jgi:hypothetical protein
MTHLIQEYAEHGLVLVPIPLGTKGPITEGWNLRENCITDPERAAAMTGNVGLAHAYCSPNPTVAIDIDDFELANIWFRDRGIDLESLLNADDAVQIKSGRPGSAKLLYRLPLDIEHLNTHKIPNPKTGSCILEFRCAAANGKTVQDVLPPSVHPDTGTTYEWAGNGDWRKLPTLPDCLIDVWPKKNGKLKGNEEAEGDVPTVTVDEQTIQHLRSALLHTRADERDKWIKAGLALKSLGEVGRGLWLEWSLTSKKGDPLEIAKTWETLNPEAIDYRHVFAEAQRQGWVNPTKDYNRENLPDDSGWPTLEPLPAELLPVRGLDPHYLPQKIRGATVDISERLTCPLDYVAIPILIGAGVVVGNRVGILPKQHDSSWEAYPGFWGGIVGPPGSMKTPALQAALKPIYHLEEHAIIAFKTLLSQYNADRQLYEKDLAKFKSGKSTVLPIEPVEPAKPRLICNDTTYQALGEILAANPSGVLVWGDELSGLLQGLDAPGQEAARGFYLSGWGGIGHYTFDRITRGTVSLSNYMLCVFGGFQPDRIKAYVNQAQGGHSQNDGLLQRFQLLAWPDAPANFALVDRAPNQTALNHMHAAIINLKQIPETNIAGAVTNARGAQLLHFDAEAQKLFNLWYVKNEKYLQRDGLSSSLRSHFSKYRSLIPGLALLFHLIDEHQGPVCTDCLTAALNFALYLKSHALRVYASVGGLDNATLRALADKLIGGKLQPGFTARSVYVKNWSDLGTSAKVNAALDVLVELGWLKETMPDTGGRKTIAYDINPGISSHLL